MVRDADPGSSALATYLAALGLVVPDKVLSDWLALVPVIALKLGSALAGVLVQAVSGDGSVRPGSAQREELNSEPKAKPVVQVVHPLNTDDAATRERVKGTILDQLHTRGGSVASSERGLAALIGASRPTVRRAINGPVMGGLVETEATRTGALVRLTAL